ncbi:response regulator [Daejeonella sp.]|uniref:response regulator n=1 Tax=Daejeonella sp. TaxID=2805397 RepID=UPI0030C48004
MEIPERFIVIDDDPTNNMICKFTLQRFAGNADIKTFTDPEMALQFIKDSYNTEGSEMPTVVFLDINMPVLDGWEVLDIFKDFSPKIKQQFSIYILSSSIDDRDKEKAEISPFVKGFLSKPLLAKTLNGVFS